jgi:hypothetical protein
MRNLLVITLVAAVAVIPGADIFAAEKKILCKKMGKTVPLAYYGEGSTGITYTTNFPKSFMVYNKRTKTCRTVIKVS